MTRDDALRSRERSLFSLNPGTMLPSATGRYSPRGSFPRPRLGVAHPFCAPELSLHLGCSEGARMGGSTAVLVPIQRDRALVCVPRRRTV